jgi:hypothetical protein
MIQITTARSTRLATGGVKSLRCGSGWRVGVLLLSRWLVLLVSCSGVYGVCDRSWLT